MSRVQEQFANIPAHQNQNITGRLPDVIFLRREKNHLGTRLHTRIKDSTYVHILYYACMYMLTCIHTHMHIYTYTWAHIFMHTQHVHIRVCSVRIYTIVLIHTHILIHTHMHIHTIHTMHTTCTYTLVLAHTHTCTYTHTHTLTTHTHTHTHTHSHTHSCFSTCGDIHGRRQVWEWVAGCWSHPAVCYYQTTPTPAICDLTTPTQEVIAPICAILRASTRIIACDSPKKLPITMWPHY